LVFYRTARGNTVLILSAVLIALGLVETFNASDSAFLYAGIALFLFYYVSKLVLELKVRALEKLEVTRKYPPRRSEDEVVSVTIELANHTFLRLWLELFDVYPKFFRMTEGSNAAVLSVPAMGYTELSYDIKPTSIGAHAFGDLRLVTRDIAGLFFYERSIAVPSTIEVTPAEKVISLAVLAPVAVSAYGGSLTSRQKGEGMEFEDIRQYEPSDPFRRIEWLSTARTGHLMVRVLRAETQLNIMVLLDSTATMAYGQAGQTKLDYSARAVASLLSYLARRGDFVGLTVIGGGRAGVIPLGRGPRQMTRIMHELGLLSPSPAAQQSFSQAVRKSLTLGGIKGRTLFFVISDLDSEADLHELKQLVAMNHEVIVISPYTPLFESHGLKGIDAILYSINVSHQWRTRAKLVEDAAKLGIPVLDVGPKDFFPRLVQQVEEMRRRGGS
jgi:uncharacterized protein (DUF58 family)